MLSPSRQVLKRSTAEARNFDSVSMIDLSIDPCCRRPDKTQQTTEVLLNVVHLLWLPDLMQKPQYIELLAAYKDTHFVMYYFSISIKVIYKLLHQKE
jgi:hypothetical protein